MMPTDAKFGLMTGVILFVIISAVYCQKDLSRESSPDVTLPKVEPEGTTANTPGPKNTQPPASKSETGAQQFPAAQQTVDRVSPNNFESKEQNKTQNTTQEDWGIEYRIRSANK